MLFTVTDSAKKDIDKLPRAVRSRLGDKLRYWERADTPLQFAAPLVKSHEATHRFRLGTYRIIVKNMDDRELRILRVRHRKDVYKRL
ncbi:MAG: type II toxin-antitoxin system RelE/ParE family toxin [bacterium]|nr:type II toxin-antitoxin system RelE/ParE family toxin [bacterium]MDZ4248025.1 type II toxin-antitoxin system RelE/ParE family toxin [Patescibacteria group bacterium]